MGAEKVWGLLGLQKPFTVTMVRGQCLSDYGHLSMDVSFLILQLQLVVITPSVVHF
jgi:hypothetical protein